MNTRALSMMVAFVGALSIGPTHASPESVGLSGETISGGTPSLSTPAPNERLLALLRARDFAALESATREIQAKFESGSLSEMDLRNTYRQFYKMEQQELARIGEWKKAFPDSYAAHLIRGVYLKRKGKDIRGSNAISQTPPENLESMRQYHELATSELVPSLKLTKKPFLSVFHLLDIAKSRGSREQALALIAAANEMLPANTLARNRYMTSLQPRWGGSYEEMRQFITRSRDEGLGKEGLIQLEAIMYDDMAFTYLERGDRQNATKYLDKTTALAQQVREDFRKEFLSFSTTPCAQKLELQKYC